MAAAPQGPPRPPCPQPDFGGGGAFPDRHFPQFPLGMGLQPRAGPRSPAGLIASGAADLATDFAALALRAASAALREPSTTPEHDAYRAWLELQRRRIGRLERPGGAAAAPAIFDGPAASAAAAREPDALVPGAVALRRVRAAELLRDPDRVLELLGPGEGCEPCIIEDALEAWPALRGPAAAAAAAAPAGGRAAPPAGAPPAARALVAAAAAPGPWTLRSLAARFGGDEVGVRDRAPARHADDDPGAAPADPGAPPLPPARPMRKALLRLSSFTQYIEEREALEEIAAGAGRGGADGAPELSIRGEAAAASAAASAAAAARWQLAGAPFYANGWKAFEAHPELFREAPPPACFAGVDQTRLMLQQLDRLLFGRPQAAGPAGAAAAGAGSGGKPPPARAGPPGRRARPGAAEPGAAASTRADSDHRDDDHHDADADAEREQERAYSDPAAGSTGPPGRRGASAAAADHTAHDGGPGPGPGVGSTASAVPSDRELTSRSDRYPEIQSDPAAPAAHSASSYSPWVRAYDVALYKLFLGPPGTITRLHYDAGRAHGWLAQLAGRKLFVAYPPGDGPALRGPMAGEPETPQSAFDPLAFALQDAPGRRGDAITGGPIDSVTVPAPANPDQGAGPTRIDHDDGGSGRGGLGNAPRTRTPASVPAPGPKPAAGPPPTPLHPRVAVLAPGEVILLPEGWWHYAVALPGPAGPQGPGGPDGPGLCSPGNPPHGSITVQRNFYSAASNGAGLVEGVLDFLSRATGRDVRALLKARADRAAAAKAENSKGGAAVTVAAPTVTS